MSYLGEEIPKLGFGLMRLPKKGDRSINVRKTCDLIDAFMGAGCTYFDTARAYADSESATRKALVERYPRDSFFLATKNAAWMRKSREEAISDFDISLEETGAGYFDFYLLHNVGKDRLENYDKWGMWDWAQELKQKGLIRHFGFSFHDSADILRQLLEAHPEVEFVQLQINWADWEDPHVQSRKCWEVAREFGKPVVIMEPVKGGTLNHPREDIMEIFREVAPERTAAEWALRFAMNTEGLITALSGMGTPEQVAQNVETWKNLTPLTPAELNAYERARVILAGIPTLPCTNCQYCMKQCPIHMNIPGIMDCLNRNMLYGGTNGKSWYAWETAKVKGSECLHCHKCERACPQHIDIVNQIERAVELFEADVKEGYLGDLALPSSNPVQRMIERAVHVFNNARHKLQGK